MSLDVPALFSEHHVAIVGYLRARTHDPELADDLAQQVWIRAFRFADSYCDTGRPVTAWLYRIAANVLLDHQRQQQRRLPMVPLGAVPEPVGVDAGSERHTDRICAASTVAWALAAAQLLPLQADVLRCRFGLGLTVAQTAKALGIQVERARKLQWRALTRLRWAVRAEDVDRDVVREHEARAS